MIAEVNDAGEILIPGLYIAFEHGNDEPALRMLQKWLSTNPQLLEPQLPASRGQYTHCPCSWQAVNTWARSAWDAYRDLQPIARQWLALANPRFR
jgi:hypothetical protein